MDLGLALEDVEPRAGDHAVAQRRGERRLVDHRPARGVDQVGVVAHRARARRASIRWRVSGVSGQCSDTTSERASSSLELDLARLVAARPLRVDDLHPERARPRRDGAADLAVADDPERLALQPAAEHEVDRPRPRLARADQPLALPHPARDREQQRDREVGRRVGQDAGRVRDDHAARAGRVHVDVVVADRDVGDDAQPRRRRRRGTRRRPVVEHRHDRLGAGDRVVQLVRLERAVLGRDPRRRAAVAQRGERGLGQRRG